MQTHNLPATFEQMIESTYLKKEDVIPDKLFTIAGFEYVNAAGEGQPPEMKFAMYFEEVPKAMLLNATNIQLLKLALGVPGPAQAVGRKIVAYNDPSVSFGGKLVGGIRLRAPRNARQAAPQQAPAGWPQAPDVAPEGFTQQKPGTWPVQRPQAPQQAGPAPQTVDDFSDDIPF